MVQTQNQGTSFIVVRGISQARNSEPSVAVSIDGVLLANPSQFNQELFDIQSIDVLKGPQGALYGRNAIGGAIVIRTREPSYEEIDGRVTVGYESGPGYMVRAGVGGPIGDSDTVRFNVSGSYVDTDGHIDNSYLDEEADPFKDTSGRARLIWGVSEDFTADFRVYGSKTETQALYFNITESVNDTSLDVRVNNRGVNERSLFGMSMKLDYETACGTLTSITAYDELDEILTGDQTAGYKEPESFVLDHGYCRSVYATDPNGMIVELTCDHPDAAKINAQRLTDARSELKRWLAGDHTSNNMFR